MDFLYFQRTGKMLFFITLGNFFFFFLWILYAGEMFFAVSNYFCFVTRVRAASTGGQHALLLRCILIFSVHPASAPPAPSFRARRNAKNANRCYCLLIICMYYRKQTKYRRSDRRHSLTSHYWRRVSRRAIRGRIWRPRPQYILLTADRFMVTGSDCNSITTVSPQYRPCLPRPRNVSNDTPFAPAAAAAAARPVV